MKGIGNSVAEWKSCFLVLSGLYLYVLDSEVSQTYQRCSRHVFLSMLCFRYSFSVVVGQFAILSIISYDAVSCIERFL